MKNKQFLSVLIASIVFIGVILLDLLTKQFIIEKLIPAEGDSVAVMPGFINFVYVKNKGAAWGMLAGRPVFLIVMSLIILALLLAFYILRIKKTGKKSSILLGISMGLIVGGCIGNLVDRFAFGYVRDFINFQFIDFPVFNFADVALTFGVIVFLVYFIFCYAKEDKNMQENLQENISFSNINASKPEISSNKEGNAEEKSNEEKDER